MQQQVLRAIREAQANGATVFFSSHVLSEVEEIADRVGIIRRGVVVEVADPQALIDRALRRVRVRFKQPIDLSELTQLPGVTLIDRSDGTSVLLNVAGDMDQLIKTLAAYPVTRSGYRAAFAGRNLSGLLRGAVMNTIFRYALLRLRGQIIGWGLALAVLALVVASLFDTALQMRGQLEQLLDTLPPEIMMFVGGIDRVFSPAGFLDTRYLLDAAVDPGRVCRPHRQRPSRRR